MAFQNHIINFSKTRKNILHYQSFCHQIDNAFNHRNFDRVSESLKFRRYLYFRQNVRSAKRPFGKTSVGKMSVRQNVFRQNVFRQSVRPPIQSTMNRDSFYVQCLSAKCPATNTEYDEPR